MLFYQNYAFKLLWGCLIFYDLIIIAEKARNNLTSLKYIRCRVWLESCVSFILMHWLLCPRLVSDGLLRCSGGGCAAAQDKIYTHFPEVVLQLATKLGSRVVNGNAWKKCTLKFFLILENVLEDFSIILLRNVYI